MAYNRWGALIREQVTNGACAHQRLLLYISLAYVLSGRSLYLPYFMYQRALTIQIVGLKYATTFLFAPMAYFAYTDISLPYRRIVAGQDVS